MKFGDYFEARSVPRWSLHNIDYNSLKQQIKTNTTRNQATAIAIPGQTDQALKKFEDAFYVELCAQHERVDLFVTSKADEICRRLARQTSQVESLLLKCTTSTRGLTAKRQRRLARLESQVVECGKDSRDLSRFVHAQDVAFRKILKKYKKWTGSTTLSSRFRENVLNNPKTFVRRDFSPTQQQCRELLAKLQAAAPGLTTETNGAMYSRHLSSNGSRRPSQTPCISQPSQPQTPYWNEYDNVSEAGEDTYVIYTNPNDSETFPGLARIQNLLTTPVNKIKTLFSSHSADQNAERRSLLSDSPTDYFSARHQSYQTTDNEATEDEDASSLEFPAHGYSSQYAALPSIEEQRVGRYREKVLHRTAIASIGVAFALLLFAGVLVFTGRHSLRLEVDAGASFAVVVSLFAACTGLGAMLYRDDALGFLYQLTTWASFITVCVLNGMLLLIVMGRSSIVL